MFLDVLDDASPDGGRCPEPVRVYLGAAGDEAGRDLRRFQLATRLARLAHQYGDTRPELLRVWARGDTGLGDGPLADTEGWQRELWARLVGPGGPIDRAPEQEECTWVLPAELFGVLDDDTGYSPPEEVHLFGFSYLWTGLSSCWSICGRTGCPSLCPFAVAMDRRAAPGKSRTPSANGGSPAGTFAKVSEMAGAAVMRDSEEPDVRRRH